MQLLYWKHQIPVLAPYYITVFYGETAELALCGLLEYQRCKRYKVFLKPQNKM